MLSSLVKMAGPLTVPTLFTSTAMSWPVNTFEILLYTLSSAWKCQLRLSSPQRSILSLFLWLHLSTCPNFYLSERFLATHVQSVLHILCLQAAIHCCRGWIRWMMATPLQRFGYRLKHKRIKPCPQNIFLFTIIIHWQIQIFKVE